ncbi:hypothetical protein [Nonomuraea turcica]|uniref:hypothetical protein n=1 Tax=Nonomuraea sp. G32 TaxID=3067274 RepID=UPI00273B1942|nr:hypothetical protein [Nonomuraea sp. G32]MDP4503599.1 hypothetical protein [Nonomuraea sp. G32]
MRADLVALLVTVEESTTAGGLGGAVAEIVVRHHPTRVRILGPIVVTTSGGRAGHPGVTAVSSGISTILAASG